MSKYEAISGTCFSIFGLNKEIYGLNFSPNTGKYGPEITPNSDTFHAVICFETLPVGFIQEKTCSKSPLLGIYLLLRNQEYPHAENIGITVSALTPSWPLFTAIVLTIL